MVAAGGEDRVVPSKTFDSAVTNCKDVLESTWEAFVVWIFERVRSESHLSGVACQSGLVQGNGLCFSVTFASFYEACDIYM